MIDCDAWQRENRAKNGQRRHRRRSAGLTLDAKATDLAEDNGQA
jgi:hypothetical protein